MTKKSESARPLMNWSLEREFRYLMDSFRFLEIYKVDPIPHEHCILVDV